MENRLICYSGNDFGFNVYAVENDGSPLEFQGEDRFVFTLTKKYPQDYYKDYLNRTSEYIIQKIFHSEDFDGEKFGINLLSEETADLESGIYYFDCALLRKNKFCTIVGPSEIEIKASISVKENFC